MSCFPAASTTRTIPVYSLSWANMIVRRALKEHGRVSDSFLEVTGLSAELLAKLLACKRPEWIVARDMLKYVDLCQKSPTETANIVKHYLTRHESRFPEKFRSYLTSQKSLLD